MLKIDKQKLKKKILLYHFQRAKKRFGQLFILISTPWYGNVGDHAIELSQLRLLKEIHINNYFEISSRDYCLVKENIKPFIDEEDVIILDGGGNLCDAWEETIRNIVDIVRSYSNNPIFMFPESWYFSHGEKGKYWLRETYNAFSTAKKMVIYARDSWSYNEMKRHLPNNIIKYSYDCVLLNDKLIKSSSKTTKNKNKNIGLIIREDKESVNGSLLLKIKKDLYLNNLKFVEIHNDCYHHIGKKARKSYVNSIIKKYRICDYIITDRFHGFLFAIILKKPCIVFDNITGKIHHFYEDVKQYLDGTFCIKSEDYQINIVKMMMEFEQLHVEKTLEENINKYRISILEDLRKERRN